MKQTETATQQIKKSGNPDEGHITEEVPLGPVDISISNPTHEYKTRNTSEQNRKVSEQTIDFRKKWFPMATDKEWNNWKWQIRNSFTSLEQLKKFLKLSESEEQCGKGNSNSLPLRITPYYASLLNQNDSTQGIRKSVVPVIDEFFTGNGEYSDPLCEHNDSPVKNLVHRYPDRVLFLVTGFCATYCRYCTRAHSVAKKDKLRLDLSVIDNAITYIENNPQIRDVLISGGDPLTLSDDRIDYLLSRIRAIPHVEFVRIGTKVPVVLPQRITSRLVSILKKYHPLFMSIHFTHPDEITPEVKNACAMLANAGIPLGSQTVLLKGINDNADTLKSLYHKLLMNRVRPYYLYQCDPVLGSDHLRTPVEKGLQIMKSLIGYTSGYAIPNFVIDAPGGGGKIRILPEYYHGKEGNDIILSNYEDKYFRYTDPNEL